MSGPVPVVVVTGPSGAGKTWLVCGLAEQWNRGKVAVVSQPQQGPVHLDPLLHPPGTVSVVLEAGCGCCGDDTLTDSLEALAMDGEMGLVLVELDHESLARPLLEDVDREAFRPVVISVTRAGLAGREEQVEEADRVVDWAELEEVVEREGGVLELLENVESDHDRGDEHDHEHDHECSCHSLGEGRAWYPFFVEEAVPVEVINGLGQMPEAVRRVQGVVMLGEEGQYSVLDASEGGVQVRPLALEGWPVVMDPFLMEQALDYSWLQDGSVLLIWAEPGDEAGEVDLELELYGLLGSYFTPAPEHALEAARDLLEEEAFLEAISAARAVVAAAPDSADHLELLARCYHRLGENRRAFALLHRALSHEPDNRSVLLNLARLHLVYDQGAEALPYIRQVHEADDDDDEARLLLGQCYLETPELRAEGVELMLATPPDDPDLLRLLVSALSGLDRVDEALEQLDRLPDQLPDGGTLYLRGHLLLRAGRADDAVDTLADAMAMGNEYSWVQRTLGAALWATGDAEAAEAVFEESLARAEQDLDEQDPSSGADLLLGAALCGELDLGAGHQVLLDAMDTEDLDDLCQEVELLQGLSAPHGEQLDLLARGR